MKVCVSFTNFVHLSGVHMFRFAYVRIYAHIRKFAHVCKLVHVNAFTQLIKIYSICKSFTSALRTSMQIYSHMQIGVYTTLDVIAMDGFISKDVCTCTDL